MQAEASKILLSGASQGKGPHDEIRVMRATLFDGRSKMKFPPAWAACSLRGGVDVHYIEMNLRRSKSHYISSPSRVSASWELIQYPLSYLSSDTMNLHVER